MGLGEVCGGKWEAGGIDCWVCDKSRRLIYASDSRVNFSAKILKIGVDRTKQGWCVVFGNRLMIFLSTVLYFLYFEKF